MGHVQAPDGRSWRVRRRWLPRRADGTWRERLARRMRSGGRVSKRIAEWLDFPFDLEGVVVVLALFALLIVGAWVVVPVALALLELAVLLPLLSGGVLARVFFGRPWEVEAVRDDAERLVFAVHGWRRSGAVSREIATRLGAGELPGASPADPLWPLRRL